MILFNGRPAIGFGDAPECPPCPNITPAPHVLPPLELRTAYTVKGLGIGAGGLVGYLAFGPLGLVLLGFTGWYVGNQVAIKAEKDYTAS